VTECLEYPDFSCVVLYGHIIIGFAFMVPDVSYNEAYVSYLFTHPEWRNAGIAKFMLYHLIQVGFQNNLTRHFSLHFVPIVLTAELHGKRRYAARFSHKCCHEPLQQVWLQGTRICSGFLRQISTG